MNSPIDGKYIALDFEAKGGGSFGPLEKVYCITWCHEGGSGIEELHWVPGTDASAAQMTIHTILGGRLPIFHGAGYDMQLMRAIGVEVPYYHCTLVMGYVVNPNITPVWVVDDRTGKKRWQKFSLAAWGQRMGVPKLMPPDFNQPWNPDWRPYAIRDAEVCWELFKWMHRVLSADSQGWQHYDTIERPYIECIMEMNEVGLYIDAEDLAVYTHILEVKLGEIQRRLLEMYPLVPGKKVDYAVEYEEGNEEGDLVYVESRVVEVTRHRKSGDVKEQQLRHFYRILETPNLASNHQVIYILQQSGWQPTKWTEKGNPQLDDDALSEIPGEFAALVREYRECSKLLGTYAKKFAAVRDAHSFVRCSWNQTVTLTGRLSSSNPVNLQNVPARKPLGQQLRRAFHAPDGYVVLDFDLSAIEYRILAAFQYKFFLETYGRIPEDVQRMLDTFAIPPFFPDGTENPLGDIHSTMALLWGVERGVGKNISFGRIFGFGPAKAAVMIGVSIERAKELIAQANETNPSFLEFREYVWNLYRQHGGIAHTLFGRRLVYPEICLEKSNKEQKLFGGRIIVSAGEASWRRARAERQAFNATIQGSNADLMKILGLELLLPMWNLGARMAAQVHDEMIFYVPKRNAEAAMELVRNVITRPAGDLLPGVPVYGDVRIADNWFDAKASSTKQEKLRIEFEKYKQEVEAIEDANRRRHDDNGTVTEYASV